MKAESSSNPTCLEVPFDMVPLAPTRNFDALRGGQSHHEKVFLQVITLFLCLGTVIFIICVFMN